MRHSKVSLDSWSTCGSRGSVSGSRLIDASLVRLAWRRARGASERRHELSRLTRLPARGAREGRHLYPLAHMPARRPCGLSHVEISTAGSPREQCDGA